MEESIPGFDRKKGTYSSVDFSDFSFESLIYGVLLKQNSPKQDLYVGTSCSTDSECSYFLGFGGFWMDGTVREDNNETKSSSCLPFAMRIANEPTSWQPRALQCSCLVLQTFPVPILLACSLRST